MLPPPAKVTEFLADASPDKRSRLIDALLDDPRFVDHWTSLLETFLFPSDSRERMADRAAFRAWLRARLAERMPYDRLVHELIAGTGKNSPGGPARDRRIAAASGATEPEAKDVNGAVNWLLQYDRSPEDLAGGAARTFLGVRIQCAQCHDHKTERWTVQDFRGLAAAFARTRAVPADDKEKGMMKTFEVKDIKKAGFGAKASPDQQAIARTPPRALDGTELGEDNPRRALADWMTAPTNPYFARATVNRMWSILLGHGLIEPVDDLRPGNPPRVPEVLDVLSADFVEHGFDLRRLVRAICMSKPYVLGEGANAGEGLWAAYRPRPLPASMLIDAILEAAGLEGKLDEKLGDKADDVRARMRQRFAFVFDVDEDGSSSDDFDGTIPQELLLLNGPLVGVASTAVEGSALAELLASPGDDTSKITALYLRTLSRRPTEAEVAQWRHFLDEAEATPEAPRGKIKAQGPLGRLGPDKARTKREHAYEDLFWTLLNASEFILQH
jgi:hypothetical protein